MGLFNDIVGEVWSVGKDFGQQALDAKLERKAIEAAPQTSSEMSPVAYYTPNIDFFGIPMNKTALTLTGGAVLIVAIIWGLK